MGYTNEELLAVVENSPARVAVHDRQGWLDLFSPEAFIEDPIGSPPADKPSGLLGKFWDTFIAPHQIRFEVSRNLFAGMDVMRDAVIHTRINERIQIDVPAYLLYQLEERDGVLRVKRMAAHWELAKLSLGALKLGPHTWWPMTRLFGSMLAKMGLSWVGGYLASLWNGVGKRGAALLAKLSDDSFAEGAVIELGDARLSVDELRGLQLVIESPVVAGYTASFRFRGRGTEGLGLVEFARGSKKIARVRLFQEMKGTSALRSVG